MPKYLVQFSYTHEGLKGLLKEGATGRQEAVDKLARSLNSKVEAYYWGFGDYDGFVLMDCPDNVSAAAAAMVVNASGSVTTKTTVLLTAKEVDQATKKSVNFRPPGA